MDNIKAFWTKATTDHRIFTARFLGFLNAISYVFMSLSVKKATHVSGLDIVYIRGLFEFLLSYFFLNKFQKNLWPELPFDKMTVLIRGIVGGVGMITIYLSLKITDLQVFAVIIASGIPMTVFLSRLAGVEQPWTAYICSFTVFFGIYLVVFPEIIPDLMNTNREITFWGIIGCFFSALMISFARIILGTRKIDTIVSATSHSIGCAIAGALLRVMTANTDILEGIIFDWFWIFSLVLLGFFYQITLAKACELEDNPSNIAIIQAFNVVLAYFLNIMFMGVEVNYVALLGSIVVMLSISILAKSKRTISDVVVTNNEEESDTEGKASV